jgi:hypothetical protein
LFSSSAASVMMTHNWCTLLEMPLLLLAKSLDLSRGLSIAASVMSFRLVSSGSSCFSYRFSVAAGLTGEFASLEDPTDDPDLAIISVLLIDGPDFTGSERQVEPEGPTKKLRLPIVNSIFLFSSTSGLLLAKSEKAVEFMIPMPRVPMVGAN